MFSPLVGKRKRTTESSPYYSSITVNKTPMMAANTEEDPNNLVSLLAGFKKDINQQVHECTDFDSINETEMSMDDNTKINYRDNPPIPVPDIVIEQQRLTSHQLYFNVVCSHKKPE